MNLRAISALVDKDYRLYFRNRFFAIITVLGIVAYLVIYCVLPKTVDENLEIGLYAPSLPPALGEIEEEGLVIKPADSEDTLKTGVTEGDYVAGISLTADFVEQLLAGNKPRVSVYFASDTPPEIRDSVGVIISEIAYQISGQSLAIDITEEILGPDMLGQQIPPRNRMRSLIAILLIVMETLGLATLISEEIARRTINALLVTPMTVKELFVAKGFTGISMSFIQAVLFMAIVGGLNRQPLLMLTALLLGSGMVVGISFLIASVSKDMMAVMGTGILGLIILMIPAFGVMFPGMVTGWVRIVPSYYLIDTIHGASNFNAGWSDNWLNLLIVLGFDIAIALIGIMVLRRKFR